jgi:predicted metal-dependent hydrolase
MSEPQIGLPFEAALTAVSPGRHGGPEPQLQFVRHRRACRYLIRVDRNGCVRVTIPASGSRRAAEAFVLRSQAWIAGERARVAEQALPPDEERRLRQQAVEILPQRLRVLAAVHALVVSRISIRNPKARWGSCSRDGHICLNWRLVRMPEWVRDYVLIHELMHLKQMNHSPAYWVLVSAACPGYRDARQWLRLNGRRFG